LATSTSSGVSLYAGKPASPIAIHLVLL
jgi:hypothetical protein